MSEGRFSGLSGLLGGTAALITAVGGVIAILFQVGVLGGDEDRVSTTSDNGVVTASSSEAQPVQRDWAAQANAICAKANDDIDALPEPESLDISQAASAGGEAVDISQRQLRELQQLTPPADDRPRIKRLLRIYAQQNDVAEELFGAIRVGDVSGLQVHIDALRRLGKSGDDLANRLGASTCAEGASFVGADLGSG